MTTVDGEGAKPKGQILIMGNRRWGVGATLAEAKRNWQAQGGRLSDGYTIITFDADTEFHGVDQMGRYQYVGNEPKAENVNRVGKRGKR
jgi:hypothetical protein